MALNNKPSRTVNKFNDSIAQGRRGRRNLSGHGNISDRKVVGAHAGARSVGTHDTLAQASAAGTVGAPVASVFKGQGSASDSATNKKLRANMSPRETNKPNQIVAAGLTK